MKQQRHLVEIGTDVVSAILVTRHENGMIGVATPKGEPHNMEVMAMLFGVVVSLVQAAEAVGIKEMDLVRRAFQSNSLEEMRDQFVRIALLVAADMEGSSND
jgi:hypothetical protein